jgi:hypothetical protein
MADETAAAAPPADRDRLSRAGAAGAALALAATAAAVAGLALYRLRDFPYPHDLRAALDGAAATLAATGPAAIKTWLFAGLAVLAVGGWLRRRAPSLRVSEAAAGAVVLLWSGAYLTLLLLGPLGLYIPLVLRILLVLVVVAATRRPRGTVPSPSSTPSRAPAGAWLAAGAFALAAGPLLLMQLGSPVSPFMDVLPYVASVQKIVTFRFYDPFGNDAAGLWAPTRQVAGCDAPFSFLALLVRLPAELAITSLMVPFAALQILAIYLLGRAVAGHLAGGMAALFLLQTFLWRRTADMRGTALAFALVAIGLAFLLGGRRDAGPRRALGGLALGLAVTVNPLIGAAGMQVASLGAVVAWLDLGRPLVAPLAALAGGSILALPQVAIGLALRVPPPLLPLVAGAGLGLLAAVARRARDPGPPRRAWPLARPLATVGLPLAALYLHARRESEFFSNDWLGYPLLVALAVGGLAVLAHRLWRRPGRGAAAALPALALAVAVLDHAVASPLRFEGTLVVRSLAAEVTTKMTGYWWPYWLALATGVWFAMLARRWALGPAVALVLVLVIYPLRHIEQPLDYDGQQLSLAEAWGFHLATAARGYHSGRGDRRWVLDDEWRAVTDALRAEVEAGRIEYATRVLHVSHSIDAVEVALGSGVSVDLITPRYDPGSIWTVGGRVRGLDAIAEALAARPPYVVLDQFSIARFPALAAAYEPLLVRGRLAVYRLREEAPPQAPGD